MDYTRRFRNNWKPDTTNFKTLAGIYGVVDSPTPGNTAAVLPPRQLQGPPSPPENDNVDDRQLASDFPLSVQQRWKEIDDAVIHHQEEGWTGPHRGWRVLHETSHGRALELELGEGYRVQLHFLLA